MKKFTHFDENGNAVMVDVTEKQPTTRIAKACGDIFVSEEVIHAITHHEIKKGDVLKVAQLAGIMGAKKTSDLIPLCHPLMIGKCQVDFEVVKEECKIHAVATVKVEGKTGVEMEALTAVTTALLTIYDMCKALDKAMRIENIHLETKTGGKSGNFTYSTSR